MELILYTLRALASVIFEPVLLIMLIVLSVFFYTKNKKVVIMQKMIIGEQINTALELTLSQVTLGIIAGIVMSLIFTFLGISFTEDSGIYYLFLFSIILMLFKPRFICFSYSGALLGLISIIVGLLNRYSHTNIHSFNIDILSLMTLIGVMHIVEAFLVMIDGDRGTIPVFTKRDNKIAGGYALSRYWLVPLAVFIAYSLSSVGIGQVKIATPDWWPLINTKYIVNAISTMVLSMTTMCGVIGYSSVTFSRRKKEKAVSSGIYILVFGIALTLIAQLCRFGIAGKIVTIIIAPLGHELMFLYQRRVESKSSLLFVSNDDGISILEVVPEAEAYDLGVRPGDKIIKVNGNEVKSEKEIYKAFIETNSKINIDVLHISREVSNINLAKKDINNFGMLLVPREVDNEKVIPVDKGKFSDILNNMQNKNKTE